jgi:hypothetical protein
MPIDSVPPLLSRASMRSRPHPAVRRIKLAPGAHPGGIYLDESNGLLLIAELGTRRLSVVDVHTGEVISYRPLAATVDPDLREQTIGGALLPGESGAAYFWSMGASCNVRLIRLVGNGNLELGSSAFVGSALLRDWAFDRTNGNLVLSVRDEAHCYVVDQTVNRATVIPLSQPGGHLAVLPEARALVLLTGPDEGLAIVNVASGRLLWQSSPWGSLRGFPRPPAGPPILNTAPVAVTTTGQIAYIGSLRTDEADRRSPLLVIDLVHMELIDLLVDERLATPSSVVLHPSGLEIYVSGELVTAAIDARRLEVVAELGPGRAAGLTVSPSGRAGVAVNVENSTAFLFDGLRGETLTAALRPDPIPTELAGVAVTVSDALGSAYVADRFGDGVLVMPFL